MFITYLDLHAQADLELQRIARILEARILKTSKAYALAKQLCWIEDRRGWKLPEMIRVMAQNVNKDFSFTEQVTGNAIMYGAKNYDEIVSWFKELAEAWKDLVHLETQDLLDHEDGNFRYGVEVRLSINFGEVVLGQAA